MTGPSTSPAARRTRTTLEEHRRARMGEAIAAAQRATTHKASIDPPMSEECLVAMLRIIDDRAAGASQLDSAALGRFLGWTAARTAASLNEAKGRLLAGPSAWVAHLLMLRGHRAHRERAGCCRAAAD